MAQNEPIKRLADKATRVMGRLPDEKRVELGQVVAEVEGELGDRINSASPSRIALAKLKLVRLRRA